MNKSNSKERSSWHREMSSRLSSVPLQSDVVLNARAGTLDMSTMISIQLDNIIFGEIVAHIRGGLSLLLCITSFSKKTFFLCLLV